MKELPAVNLSKKQMVITREKNMNYVTFFTISGICLFAWFAIAVAYAIYDEFVKKKNHVNTPRFLVKLEALLLNVGVIFLIGGAIDWFMTK